MLYPIHLSISLAGKRQHQNLPQASAAINDLLNALEAAGIIAGCTFQPNILSGLADGGDMIGAAALLHWREQQRDRKATLTGVFPFERDGYLQTITAKAQFETLLAACNQRIFLDGRYLPDVEGADNTLAKECRAAAYRQQARYLVEAGDVLLAIADETETGKAGGTLETVDLALSRSMMVVFLSLCSLELYLLTSAGQFTRLRAGDTEGLTCGAAGIAEALIKTFNAGYYTS